MCFVRLSGSTRKAGETQMIKDMRILLLTCYFNNLRSNIAAFGGSGGFLECHLSPFPFYRREKLFGRPPQRRFPRCEVPDEPSRGYGKPLTRLTGPKKAREMAIIRASCGWRDRAATAGVCHLGAKTWGRPGPSLRLSLPGRHLVNSVAGAASRAANPGPRGRGGGLRRSRSADVVGLHVAAVCACHRR